MVANGPRQEVRNGPDEEGKSRERPRGNRPSTPFEHLSQIVRARNPSEQPTLWNLELGLPGPSQIPQNSIRRGVDCESRTEDRQTYEEPGIPKPPDRILRTQREEITSVEVGVQNVEEKADAYDDKGKSFVAPQESREDERPVDIMKFPEEQERDCDRTACMGSKKKEKAENRHCRDFHQNPSRLVAYMRPPSRALVSPVRR